MRVVFLGTPEFALPSLRALGASRYEISAVFTQPDRPAGRGQKPSPPPVKRFALEHGIPVHQPARIRSDESRTLLEALRPEFLVVVAYGQILPRWLLELPLVAPVNVHASLLPRYRGAAPVAWAILRGEAVTGCTTMLIEETLDTGPALLARSLEISPEATCGELQAALAELGAELLIPTLDGLASGRLVPRPQDETRATLAPKITKDMARLDWRSSAGELHNRIRAFQPWPVARTSFRSEPVLVHRSRPPVEGASASPLQPGSLAEVTDDGIAIACGDGVLQIVELQLAGGKRMTGRAFAAGSRIAPGRLLFE
jgi:methionyl-tRNA formyltransferase